MIDEKLAAEENQWYRERRAEFKELSYRRAHLREQAWHGVFLGSLVFAVTVWFDNPELSILSKVLVSLSGLALCWLCSWRGELAEQQAQEHEAQRQHLSSAQMFEREIYTINRAYEVGALPEATFRHLEYCVERAREERDLIKWRTP